MLTVERVAGLLSCSQRYVYDQVKAGRLVGTKLGRSVKISRQNSAVVPHRLRDPLLTGRTPR
jgi:excisionase family DNA binding protein